MSIALIPTARAFKPFLQPARYKAAYGGRGSGKTWFFGGLAAELCYCQPTRIVCLREVQKDLKDSSMQIIVDQINKHNLQHAFTVNQGEIRGPNNSIIIFRGMHHYNADSIKSLEGFDIAWVAEAQAFSERSLDYLRPTLRKDTSELWFDWNPTDERDAVDQFFRGEKPPRDAIIRRVNWRDNPWFPKKLHQERADDYAANPAKAAHIWEGDYEQAPKGAYFADLLAQALTEGRISRVPHEPGIDVHVAFDLGNGANMAAWFTQWIGKEIRIIDYLEGDDDAVNEGWPWYVRKLKEKRYIYAPIILPHDARPSQRVTGKGDEQALHDLGFNTVIVPRMDPMERVRLIQRILPLCWIDSDKCAGGLPALKNYRENIDDKLRVSRGPLHDWSSHAADALGHMCQAYEAPRIARKKVNVSAGAGAWMG